MPKTDVTILGGGPVGCLFGILLRDMGLEVVLVEREIEPYKLPRAIVMDDEIHRLLSDHGMDKWLGAHTSPLERGDFVDADGHVLVGADIPSLGLQGVPPVVCHFQPELDAMLREEFVARGGDARFGRTITSLVDHSLSGGNGVEATIDDGEIVESRWFVGCDGASSWTRKTVDLSLEDLKFDQEWLVVDVQLHEHASVALPLGVRQYCDAARPSTYVKGVRNFRRWEFQVQEHEDASRLNTEDGLWSLLRPWLTPDDAVIVRSAVYRFHAVVAPQLRRGSVFLAGDSAHQMPPFAGQGLNSGMRDAINLAWKMAFVHRGLATERMLDMYTVERVPHVRDTVASAVDMGLLIDQLAGRVSHGVGIESGYGGGRPSPYITSGMVVGDDQRVGRQFWFQPEVSRAVTRKGASFAVVASGDIELPRELVDLDARVVVSPQAVGDAYAIVVRPDRFVAAVARDASELEQHSRELAECL